MFEFAFDGSKTKGRGRESVLRLETVASGYLNAVVFWFDLHMDERETITTAPAGVGKGGRLREEERFEGDKEGLEAERRRRDEAARDALERAVARHRETLERNPRTDLGAAKAEAERRATEEKEEERKKKTNPDDDPGALGDAGEIVASAIEPEDEPEGLRARRRAREPRRALQGQALSTPARRRLPGRRSRCCVARPTRGRSTSGGRRRVRREPRGGSSGAGCERESRTSTCTTASLWGTTSCA